MNGVWSSLGIGLLALLTLQHGGIGVQSNQQDAP